MLVLARRKCLLNSIVLFCRVDWMLEYQGMVCLAGNQVWWTWEVEDVFRKVKKGAKTALKDYAKRLHGQIDRLVVKVRTGQGYCVNLMSRSLGQHTGRTTFLKFSFCQW